jgi:4-amino-4-deoxy-L-arabinose transferase-like glycosyltransferase
VLARLRAHRGLLAVLALAALLRLIPLALIVANGGSPLIGDEGNYVEAAQSLAHGAGIPDRWIWIRPPGYIVFLAAIFRLTQDSLIAAQVTQIVVSLLTIAATYGLALAAFGGRAEDNPWARRVALLAAGILALEPSLIFGTALFLTETLFLLLITGMLWALVAYYRATSPRRALGAAAAAGALAGAALLTRASLIPLVLFALVLFVARRGLPRATRLRAAALFLALIVACLAPWTMRNAARYGRFLPLDTAGYYAVWTGATDLPLSRIRQSFGAIPNPADRGNYALAQAAGWIVAHPDRFLPRAAARLAAGILPDDFAEAGFVMRDKLPGRDFIERDVFAFLTWWGYALLLGAALIGWLRAPRDILWVLTAGLVAAYLLTIAFTPNEFRYRYQLFSVFAIYAARAFPLARRAPAPAPIGAPRALPAWLLPLAVWLVWLVWALPTFWPGFVRAVEAAGAAQAGAQARARGDLAGAVAQYAAAARLEPTSAAVRRDLGAIDLAAGRPDAALAAWGDALQQEPGDWRARALLADLWRRQGQPKRAAATAREVPPTFNAVMLAWAWGRLDAAPPLTVTVGWDDIGFVRGFQIGEDAAEGPSFRWAGPGAASSVRLRGGLAAGARLALLMHSLPHAPPGPATRAVTVRANNRPLTTLDVAPGWTTYTLDLPPEVAAAPEIVVDFLSEPQQASADDPRLLSFALQRAAIVPGP